MNASKERIEAIFGAAIELKATEQREVYLAKVCGGDQPLRSEVEALLQAYDKAGSFLTMPSDCQATVSHGEPNIGNLIVAVAEQPGDRIGHYKLLEQIGEGGCGVVYVAEQEEPVRRRVALKVIKLGMDTKSVIARFEAERQALALMDHPNIAKVFDAGATETGRPFFVMELVRGIKITDYCDQNNLSTPERLNLFIQVCHAIQHAHQKGIIHRDIKPSNILVTLHDGMPVPKVIDFGIAKATAQQRLTDKTVYTAFEQFIGTPAYMSPEQAEMSGLDIDTRSDVYALGVLLYELLTGKTPFDAQALLAMGLDAMRKTIREQEPLRPSTRLSTLVEGDLTTTAKHRHSEPPKLIHLLRGDLDWIVMKCLEKDRTRRYETANGLAYDVERHLKHDLVTARPPSVAYKAQKFVRRNRLMVTASGLVAAALVLGVAMSTWLAFREKHQRERAEASEQKALQSQAEEARQRRASEGAQRKAETEELFANQQAYAADMKEVQRALEDGELGLARELLNKHRPIGESEIRNPKIDLRGWEWCYFWSRCQSEERCTLYQYSNSVSALAFSADGNWLAVRRRDNAIALWDTAAKRPTAELPAQGERWCRALAFSPQENLLAWGSKDASGTPVVSLWDVTAQKAIAALSHSATIASVSFAPDGKELAALAHDGTVRVWNLESLQVVTQVLPAAVGIKPDRLSASAKVTATSAADADVEYPGLESQLFGTRFTTPTIFTGHYGCVRFSPDGRWLAVGEARPQIRLQDRTTGQGKIIPVPPPAHGITALAFSPDSQWLAAACGAGDSDIHVWILAEGTRVRLAGHSGGVVDLAFSSDGQWLASVSADQSLRLWDVHLQAEPRRFQGNGDKVLAVAWSPDGQTLVTGASDGSVRYWDPAAKPVTPFAVLPERIHVWGPAFFPDSKTFLTATRPEGAVVRWDTVSLQVVERLSFLGTNHTTLDLSRDGHWLALGDASGNVQVWDLHAHRLATNLFFPESEAFALFFSPRGSMLACGAWGSDGSTTGKIWTVAGWREINLSGVSFRNLFEADFSPDEQNLACGYEDGTAAWWDLATRQRQAFFDCHYSSGVHVAFSPDGYLFATAELEGLMTVWDGKTHQSQPIGHGYRDWLHDLAFSADGRRLIASGTGPEGVMKLWDVATGRNVATLPGESGWFCRIGFSPDGNTIYAVSKEEGTALFWRAPSFAEIEAAEKAEAQVPPQAQIPPPNLRQPLLPTSK